MGKDTQETTVLTAQPLVGREFSAGGVVYKEIVNPKTKKLQTLWLVAKNTPSKAFPEDIWRLQKGWIDDKEGGDHPGPISSGEIKATEKDLQTGALREVREEGGVIAKIIKKIETSKYFMTSTRGRVMKFVTFYLMEYVEDAPEGFCFETSEIAWLPFDDAYKKITFSNEKKILKEASELLAPVA